MSSDLDFQTQALQVENNIVQDKKIFKGNKQYLPSKPCKTCGRDMTWRKAWAKNWDQVLYCSDACRQHKTTLKRTSNGI